MYIFCFLIVQTSNDPMMKDVWKELIVERGGLLKKQYDAFTKVFILLLRIYFRNLDNKMYTYVSISAWKSK